MPERVDAADDGAAVRTGGAGDADAREGGRRRAAERGRDGPVALAKKEGYFEIVQRLGDDPADVEPAFAKAAPAKGLTFSRVVATYPAGVKPCTTVVDVTSASPTCQWQTLGIVEHRNHQPLLQYYGTHVRLKVPARVGGVTYPAGTLLTLDEDQSWVAVTSWD